VDPVNSLIIWDVVGNKIKVFSEQHGISACCFHPNGELVTFFNNLRK